MPLSFRKASLVPSKRKAEVMAEKGPKEANKAPAKAITAAASGEPDPKGLMKGRVAEVDTSSLRRKIGALC